jgi:hypothetical protein
MRDDENFAYVAAWEYKIEQLVYENIKLHVK